jgi:hypothetical protein
VHKKIGIYGWVALGLLLILMATIMHYECKERQSWKAFHRPMYIRQNDNWIRDIDRDFENMRRQMDIMRDRHEEMIRSSWEAPPDTENMNTTIVANGDYQYSVNTRDDKLDGFVTTSDVTKAGLLLAQIKSLGLSVDQKDNKLFFNGNAQKMNGLLKILGK